MIRPNFTDITRDATSLIVRGKSDPSDSADILGIRVVLTQGEHIATPVIVETISGDGSWNANVDAGGFEEGTAVAFGIETHGDNFTTITWTQALPVPPKA